MICYKCMNKNVNFLLYILVDDLQQEDFFKKPGNSKNNTNLICFTAGSFQNQQNQVSIKSSMSKGKK